jgi:tRNA(Ile)-lysidine synthase
MSIVAHLAKQLKHELESSTAHFVVAYSAGVDSHVLMHALNTLRQQYNFQLSAIHIHHGLSQNADQWLKHCESVCSELQVTIQCAKVELKRLNRQSLEALARNARYAKLQELAPRNSIVLLAQHQDDQLETFLLQLKRGAGPKGLSGMTSAWQVSSESDATEVKSVQYLRPLLALSQAQILEYANEKSLVWQEDESNLNTDFDRNFLRQKILPELSQRWPQFAKSASRSANLCAEQQALLDEVSLDKLLAIQTSKNTLDIGKLCLLSESWQIQVIRLWLARQRINSPSQSVLEQLNAELFAASDDANPIIQWRGWQFRRFDQQLFVLPVSKDLSGTLIDWNGESTIDLPLNLASLVINTTSLDKIEDNNQLCMLAPELGQISIRFGGYTDKFKPLGELQSKPLKQWFKLWKIPPWQRDKVAIILQNNTVQGLLLSQTKLVVCEGADSVQSQLLLATKPPQSYMTISVKV